MQKAPARSAAVFMQAVPGLQVCQAASHTGPSANELTLQVIEVPLGVCLSRLDGHPEVRPRDLWLSDLCWL